MSGVIEATGLTKKYGDLVAVDHVDLTVQAGSFFGVLGPNGAGKTTLLEMIEGLRKPDAGTATILGEPSWPRNAHLLPQLGVQLQASAFFERLTAKEQLTTFADLYGVRHSRVDEMLELVGLTEHAKKRTEDLSGGQRQRLSIACSLVHDPQVVFLDEPTAALDPQARRNLWELLSAINDSGRTVVLTTHHMDEAEALCDLVAVMDHGRILTVDHPAALVRGLDAPTRISLPETVLSAERARTLPAALEVDCQDGSTVITTRDPAAVLTTLAQWQALTGLQVRGATLEDVFLQLTGREYRA
ncbi:MAG: ABC transporter ATP-binding protein [Austwickia sp.]|jgi:ABC-2 type transport system ATP-binding protein|nr:ABC transporter ATP-binding protein [Austwickia sp.]MBK8435557.1 ABC transporter ATP-binding protein [Austwickia sp.]MBK9100871.1 ABC transporter ATP-binding protein [Austwickia sp.]